MYREGILHAWSDGSMSYQIYCKGDPPELADNELWGPNGQPALREILRLAEENNALQITVEEGNEIEAETLAVLAVLCGDGTLKECVDGCPGHLKPEAMKRYKEALRRWVTMAEENERLRLEAASSEAVLAMAVARLGGLVEGAPTGRHNFLQRIDALVEKEELYASDAGRPKDA